MTTYSAKDSDVTRAWHLVDLEGKTVGRAASVVASLLRGKHKPIFTPHVDTGDFVVCINADKMVFTGRKLEQKKYYSHTGFVGGIKEKSAKELMEEAPDQVFEKAVRGMLPKNSLGRRIGKKLKVYAGNDHPHDAQNPQVFEI